MHHPEQETSSNTHSPETHRSPVEQTFPHSPQLNLLLSVFTQPYEPDPPQQLCPEPQTVVQEPQLDSWDGSTQPPFSGQHIPPHDVQSGAHPLLQSVAQ